MSAFSSVASDLVVGDENGAVDVFVLDRVAGETTRVSVTSAGGEAEARSSEPSISADGRYVAFSSQASDLVAGDTNARTDIFVHDRVSAETKRVSLGEVPDTSGDGDSYEVIIYSGSGAQANGHSSAPSISADGRSVAFRSDASDLVAGDTNAAGDVFVRDLVAGETIRASVGSGGGQANGESSEPSISGDGRLVAFRSGASNLVAGDTNAAADVFVRDRFATVVGGGDLLGRGRSPLTGETTRVSVTDAGAQAGGQSSEPAISSDGRYVAFTAAADLPGTGGDYNGRRDVYVRDRAVAGTVWASKGMSGSNGDSHSPAISGEGSYVAFVSGSALGEGDTNGVADVYERELATDFTTRLSFDDDRAQADGASAAPSLSGDATYAAFASLASNLTDDDTALEDVFVHAWSVDPDLLLPLGAAGPAASGPEASGPSGGEGCGPALVPAPPAGDAPEDGSGEGLRLPSGRTAGRCDTDPVSRAPAVYHAKQYDANPAQDGSILGEEWVQLKTHHARRVDPEQITTRNIVRCPVGRCGEVRMRTRAGESDPAAADDYAVERGTSADDPRLEEVVDMLEAVSHELGPPAGTGPIGEAVEGWQTLPPGHGLSYQVCWGLHVSAVEWWRGVVGWPGLSRLLRGASGVVRRGLEVPGLP